jgi:hypothetical protein
MTTPRLGVPELTEGQAAPETGVNEMVRYLEQGAGFFTIVDRDLSTPPGSPVDGDAYIVAGTGLSGWAGHDGDIAFRMSTGWEFINIAEGMAFWIEDENKFLIATSGSTFAEFLSSTSINATDITTDVSTQSGTSYTLVLGDANSVIEFSNAGAITLTIPPNASVAFPVGTFIEIHQTGGGAVTPTPDTGVTLQVRTGFSETAGQYAVAAIRKVATNTWRLTGDLT